MKYGLTPIDESSDLRTLKREVNRVFAVAALAVDENVPQDNAANVIAQPKLTNRLNKFLLARTAWVVDDFMFLHCLS